MVIKINEEQITIKEPTPLLQILQDNGYVLPCSGKGICGRCKITSTQITPTNRDYKFLSAQEIAAGIRISCDKIITSDINITCGLTKFNQRFTKMTDCDIAVHLGYQNIVVRILNKDFSYDITEVNPIFDIDKSLVSVRKDIIDTNQLKVVAKSLRAAISRMSIELLEKFGVPKATLLSIIASKEMLALLFGKDVSNDKINLSEKIASTSAEFPSEEIYLLPYDFETIGSDACALLNSMENSSLLLDCREQLNFYYKGITNFAVSIDNLNSFSYMQKNEQGIDTLALIATLQYFIKTEKPNNFILLGCLDSKLLNDMINLKIDWQISDYNFVQDAGNAVTSLRLRTKLNKTLVQTVSLDLANDSVWQDILSTLTI